MLANVPDRMTRVLRLAGINAIVGVHTPGEPEPWLEDAWLVEDVLHVEREQRPRTRLPLTGIAYGARWGEPWPNLRPSST